MDCWLRLFWAHIISFWTSWTSYGCGTCWERPVSVASYPDIIYDPPARLWKIVIVPTPRFNLAVIQIIIWLWSQVKTQLVRLRTTRSRTQENHTKPWTYSRTAWTLIHVCSIQTRTSLGSGWDGIYYMSVCTVLILLTAALNWRGEAFVLLLLPCVFMKMPGLLQGPSRYFQGYFGGATSNISASTWDKS